MDHGYPAEFATALRHQFTDARKRRGLSQRDVARRTDGLISPARLSNYESGHRGIRAEMFWLLARALGEDPGNLFAGAELALLSGFVRTRSTVTVRVADVLATTEQAFAPMRKWFTLRHPDGPIANATETVDPVALQALANLVGITVDECRDYLCDPATGAPAGDLGL